MRPTMRASTMPPPGKRGSAVMSFALEEKEPISTAVRRMAVEQIDLALRHLGAPSEDIDGAIHSTRQSLKRVRALLMLARSELGEEAFEREWSCFRDAGRPLAEGRDAAVVVETLNGLVI